MTYTFSGHKDYVSNEISKIKKSFSSENISIYDLDADSIDSAICDINTVSLFGDKLVIVYGIDLLDDASSLLDYLNNQSSNTLILVSFNTLDKRKKITKVLKELTTYKEYFDYDLVSLVRSNLDDFEMNISNINLLISYCSGNLVRILSELLKLKTYKFNEKVITSDDINLLVKKSYDSTIFNLIDAINVNDKDKVFEIYNELLDEGESDEKIMYTIANHYRLLFQISKKVLIMSDSDIISFYKMHPYRLTKLKEQLRFVDSLKCLSILKKLSDIDIRVKSGKGNMSNEMIFLFSNL